MNRAKVWYTSKTILFGLATAVAPAALTYAAGVDWTQFGVSPAAGGVIGTIVVALRTFTSKSVKATS